MPRSAATSSRSRLRRTSRALVDTGDEVGGALDAWTLDPAARAAIYAAALAIADAAGFGGRMRARSGSTAGCRRSPAEPSSRWRRRRVGVAIARGRRHCSAAARLSAPMDQSPSCPTPSGSASASATASASGAWWSTTPGSSACSRRSPRSGGKRPAAASGLGELTAQDLGVRRGRAAAGGLDGRGDALVSGQAARDDRRPGAAVRAWGSGTQRPSVIPATG